MKIGKIISVEYDKFRVRLYHTTKNSTVNIGGNIYYFGNIGSYLKTKNPTDDYIFCEVTAIVDYITEENKIYSSYNLDSSREIIIKPIGTLKGNEFKMGIGIFPSLYSDVEIVTFDDLKKILTSQYNDSKVNDNEKDGIHKFIDIGNSKSLINYKIQLGIDELFNIHTAILGNSGSGKSNTIARILQEVYKKENNNAKGAKTIIFDANGEYPIAFNDELLKGIKPLFYKPNLSEGKVTKSKTKDNGIHYAKFILPYYLMNLDEWLSFLMTSERVQKPFWDNVLQECYRFYMLFNKKDDESAGQFSNYIKWKTYKILLNLIGVATSDTIKMTTAKGVIQKMKSTAKSITVSKEVNEDLQNFFTVCEKLCTVSFGNNNGLLSDALPNFIKSIDSQELYVQINEKKSSSKQNAIMYETKLCSQNNGSKDIFRRIDEEKAQKINEEKLKSGEYYDYKFLKTAVEITLLEEEANGNIRIREFTSTLLARLDNFLYNDECAFMRMNEEESNNDANNDANNTNNIFKNEKDYLEKMFGIDKKEKQLIIIDLSEVGTETMELITSVISRLLFDNRKSKYGGERRRKPIHIILDEAHRYIHKDTNYIMHENIFEKIAREGRKYSLYLIVSSQRPSELSSTVLSQCGNYIVHRIQNEVDLKYIYSVLPYFSEDYISKIKQAVPGEALIFGNCVPMPLMIKVDKAEPSPDSDNCKISEEWFGEK